MSEQKTNTSELDPRLTDFIAIGSNHGWGRAKTEAEAIRTMHAQGNRASEFHVYRCTAKTCVNEMGGFTRPSEDPAPVKIRSKLKN